MEMDSETTERFITSVERHRIGGPLLCDCTDRVVNVMIKIARIIYMAFAEFDVTGTQCNKNVRFYRTFVTSRKGRGY